jgi:nitroimidazol reductase NimA-like FMN-containing flavoprotein (pyridoxamine 5'-phosphate oxidase superfamily)
MTERPPWLEQLSYDECVTLLRSNQVGRLAMIVDGYPMILPVNYRLAETSGRTWITIRTRVGGEIDRAPLPVAFEIDGADPFSKRGWSVLVRGTLQHVDPDAADFARRFDPGSWLADRDAWLVIEPITVTGRRLHPGEVEWAFHTNAYL